MENRTARNFIGSFTTTASLIRSLSLSALMLGSLVVHSLAAVKEVEIVGRPAVDEDQVTVRIKVRGEGDLPVTGLQDKNFRLMVKDPENGQQEEEALFRPQDWKSPKEATPPPAWVIILLDFTGSMTRKDLSGRTKLEGAIGAIREYTRVLESRAGNTQIAIIPFSSGPTEKCKAGYVVNSESDIDKFFAANDVKLQNYLDYLEAQTPCAATDLYTPLETAVDFLAKRFPVPAEEDTSQLQPRLSIILLSDGFHSIGNEEEGFQQLTDLLKRNSNILVHTLGYGLTPEQLGAKYKLGRAARRSDLNTVPAKDREEFQAEYVDYERLKQIAGLTGGLFAFSGDAQKVAASLQRFLDDLFGEYEITYTDPRPERGAKHTVQAIVEDEGTPVSSDPKPYTIDVFGRSVPIKDRLPMLAFVLAVLAGGGVLPFWLWAKSLKQDT